MKYIAEHTSKILNEIWKINAQIKQKLCIIPTIKHTYTISNKITNKHNLDFIR